MSYQRNVFDLVAKLSGQSNIVAVPRLFCQAAGSLEGGTLLAQMLHWCDKGRDPDGWFFKTYIEWHDEVYLTEYQVRKFSKQFEELGFLETKLKKANGSPTLHYRIDQGKFLEWILKFSRNQDSENLKNPLAKISESLTEITTETTKPEITTGLKTHPPVVSSLITRAGPPTVQNGWVGLADDLPALDSFSVSEEEDNGNRDQDIPPIVANADEQSLSATPPPPGLTPAQALAYKMLTDPEITEGIYAPEKYTRRVKGWITKYGDEPIKLIKWVGAWWVEREAGIVDIGALGHRIDNCEAPAKCPPAFLESDFYHRLYPLTKAEAEARDRARIYTGKAPPHPLGKLLDALPVPIWEDPPC